MRDGWFRLPDERKSESVGDTLEKVLQMSSSSRSGVRIMMNASNPPGEAPLVAAPPPAPSEPTASPTSRLIAGLAGVLLLLIVLSHVKLALAGMVGAGVAWQVQRVRRRPYTRTSGWIGAVALTCLSFVATVGLLAANAPNGTLEAIMQKTQQDQSRRPPPKPPAFLRQLTPGMQPSPVADSLTQQIVRSRPFTMGILVFTAFIGAGVAGLALGTLGWATATALLFAVFGRWAFDRPGLVRPV